MEKNSNLDDHFIPYQKTSNWINQIIKGNKNVFQRKQENTFMVGVGKDFFKPKNLLTVMQKMIQ